LDRDVRPFLHAAGQLHQAVHQEPLPGMEHGRVVRAAAVVDADDDPVLLHQSCLCPIVSAANFTSATSGGTPNRTGMVLVPMPVVTKSRRPCSTIRPAA